MSITESIIFTYHTLGNLKHFMKEHQEILQLIQEFRANKSQQNARRIMTLARTNSEHAMNYLLPFTKNQLTAASNFIESAWLVNKFPDELYSLGDAVTRVKNTRFDEEQLSYQVFSDLIESIRHRIQRLGFCIGILEDERKKIGLSPLKDDLGSNTSNMSYT
jgi:hypothetical protein